MIGRPVIVLGMHRSGTSALTRAVNLMGVPFISGDELIGAGHDNPAGFWESAPLARLNDQLLSRVGSQWWRPPGGPLDFADIRLRDLREDARILVGSAPPGSWLWKDPRTCLTLPFWLPLLPAEPLILFCHRDPVAVARSLARRNGISFRHGLGLWERYVRSALSASRGLPALTVHFEGLMQRPAAVLAPLAQFLQQQGAAAHLDPRAGASELRSDLDHAEADDLGTPSLTPEQEALLRRISLLPPSSEALEMDLPAETPGLDDLFDDQSIPFTRQEALTERAKSADSLRAHLTELRAALDRGPLLFGGRAVLRAVPAALFSRLGRGGSESPRARGNESRGLPEK